jgi:hypothetical protein
VVICRLNDARHDTALFGHAQALCLAACNDGVLHVRPRLLRVMFSGV